MTRKTIPLLANRGVSVAGAHRGEKLLLGGHEIRVVIADSKRHENADCWPVSEPSLSKEFARITNERALLKFNDRYGLLGYRTLHEAEMLRRSETWQGDPLDWALAHAKIASGIHGAVDVINEFRSGKRKLDDRTIPFLLRTLFAEFKKMGLSVKLQREPPRTLSVELGKTGRRLKLELPSVLTVLEWRRPETLMSESYSLLRKTFSSRWGKDPIGTAYVVLSWIVGQYIRRVHFEFVSSDYARRFFGMSSGEPRFGLELRWDALIEVIYWQLAERIGGAFRACRRCGRTFPMSTGKTLYCSRECGDALRSQRYRDNKKKKRRTLRKARVPRTRKANAVSSRRAR